MYKLDLGKAEEPEKKSPTSAEFRKSKRIQEKTSTSASLTMLKPLTTQVIMNCGKFKRWEYQTVPAF